MPGSIKSPFGVCVAMARSRSPRRLQCGWEGCGKSIGQTFTLQRHASAVHECVKPHTCDICQATCGQKCHLDTHKRCVREGTRPYACDLCEATIGQSHHLADHIRTVHEGSRPFECDLCPARFGTKRDLVRHKRSVHSTKAQKRIRQRAEQTHDALSENGFTFDRELRIKFSSRAACPFSARVDFAVLRTWGYVYVDVDEHPHKPFPEGHDALRMQLLLAEHMLDGRAGKAHVIRFNLDACSLNGVRQKLPLKYCMDALAAVLGYEPVKQYTITYVYYDRSDCPTARRLRVSCLPCGPA